MIVHLYEEDGADVVDRLVGMFAFAHLGRARGDGCCWRATGSGIKPLYWTDRRPALRASRSEIKALLPLLGARARSTRSRCRTT